MSGRYYIRHEIGVRWWNFPWQACEGPDYPHGRLIHIACTRRGALRIIRRERRRKLREAARGGPQVETELVSP